MTARPHISVKDKVTVAIAQAPGGHIVCPLCGKWLGPDQERILEHVVCRAFTNSDAVEYLAWVHKPCADAKTFGKSKATCADGDIHKIAKAKRLALATEVHKQVLSKVISRPQSKLRGRGFDRTKTRKFSGEVVERK